MKRLIMLVLAAAVVMMGACTEINGAQTPEASESAGTAPKPTAAAEETATDAPPTEEPDDFLASQIEAAEKCRVSTQDAEYYFDTDIPIGIYNDIEPEFPLYRMDKHTDQVEYMGTTGFSFQLCDRFIYIKSDMLQEDWPVGEMTRVVNMDTGVITPLGRNIDIFIPEDGGYVYYTMDGVSAVYKAVPSLVNAEKFDIQIPDNEEIEDQIDKMDDVCTHISIMNVEDGWVYFLYDVFEYEGSGLYEGRYRVSTNGSRAEKTDNGRFFSAED